MTLSGLPDAAADRTWLSAPWGQAMVDFIMDPTIDLDPPALPGWPDWAALNQASASPALRRRLTRHLVADRAGAVAGLIADCATPRGRLVLVPAAEATALVRRAAAWWQAPRLAALLQRTEVDAARQALGADAIAFALGAGRLLPRPTGALATAMAAAADDQNNWTASGSLLFALAVGEITDATRRRIGLRGPAHIWQALAGNCRDDAAGAAAFSTLHRITREAAPDWSNWLH